MGSLSPKREKDSAGISVAGQQCLGQINVTCASQKQGKQKSESSKHLLHSHFKVRMPMVTLCRLTCYLSTTTRSASAYLQKRKKYRIEIFGKTRGRDIILAERFQQQATWGVAEVPGRAFPQHLLKRSSSPTTDRLTVSLHERLRKK